jgi:hypothetical protein
MGYRRIYTLKVGRLKLLDHQHGGCRVPIGLAVASYLAFDGEAEDIFA